MNLSDFQSEKASSENNNENLGQSDEFPPLRMSSPHIIPHMLEAGKKRKEKEPLICTQW
jgi:hypothetical protein